MDEDHDEKEPVPGEDAPPAEDPPKEEPVPEEEGAEVPPEDEEMAQEKDDKGVIGSAHMRPIFLGNLTHDARADDIADMFEKPFVHCPGPDGSGEAPVPVDRVDLKRGFCFVFLKDAETEADKRRAEDFVSAINGKEVPGVSKQLRSEFARGDGRIKRKEDDRRKRILPSETLFVVNFHEQTTKREDLQMLFSPFGEIVRIDMKRNYAFVQFTNIEDAKRAKEATNGGKLDQSVITVEFVARRMGDADRRRERGDRDRQRDRAPAYGRGSDNGRGYGRRDDYDDRRGGNRGRDDRYDDYRGRDRSPGRDRWGYRGRGRSRSRSRSPGGYRHRSRSPSPSYRKHRDDYRDRDGRGRSPDRDHRDSGRGRSPDRDYRGDRDRGYRS
mmetsp:Transcript_46637/g.141306  ORF Transcript_46637/g.141306 Transcript_46637/m.141306 type:complete len:384 (-) Transcript_46637:255-1406(-)